MGSVHNVKTEDEVIERITFKPDRVTFVYGRGMNLPVRTLQQRNRGADVTLPVHITADADIHAHGISPYDFSQ